MSRLDDLARARTWCAVLALTTLLAACGGTASSGAGTASGASASVPGQPSPTPSQASSVAPPSASSGSGSGPTTGQIHVPEHGYTVTLPDGWKRIPLDKAAVDAIVAQLPPGSEMGRMLSSQAGQLSMSGIDFWAMKLTPDAMTSGFTPNVNVMVQPANGLSLGAVKAMAEGQLGNMESISNLHTEDTTLPAGQAVKATYDLNQPTTAGSPIRVSGLQYYLVAGANLYIISLSCGGPDPQICAADFDELIQSLSLDG